MSETAATYVVVTPQGYIALTKAKGGGYHSVKNPTDAYHMSFVQAEQIVATLKIKHGSQSSQPGFSSFCSMSSALATEIHAGSPFAPKGPELTPAKKKKKADEPAPQ